MTEVQRPGRARERRRLLAQPGAGGPTPWLGCPGRRGRRPSRQPRGPSRRSSHEGSPRTAARRNPATRARCARLPSAPCAGICASRPRSTRSCRVRPECRAPSAHCWWSPLTRSSTRATHRVDRARGGRCGAAARAAARTGLVNAVLRRFVTRARRAARRGRCRSSAATAHPAWLVERICAAWPTAAEAILEANNAHPPMTLRVDLSRTSARTTWRALRPLTLVHMRYMGRLPQSFWIARCRHGSPGLCGRRGLGAGRRRSARRAAAQAEARACGCWMPARLRAARPATCSSCSVMART